MGKSSSGPSRVEPIKQACYGWLCINGRLTKLGASVHNATKVLSSAILLGKTYSDDRTLSLLPFTFIATPTLVLNLSLMFSKVYFVALGMVALPLLSRAQEPVSGVSRTNLNGVEVQFSLDVFDTTVTSIVNSLDQGPNRTLSDSLPVPKLRGVNIGNWLLSEPWYVLNP